MENPNKKFPVSYIASLIITSHLITNRIFKKYVRIHGIFRVSRTKSNLKYMPTTAKVYIDYIEKGVSFFFSLFVRVYIITFYSIILLKYVGLYHN